MVIGSEHKNMAQHAHSTLCNLFTVCYQLKIPNSEKNNLFDSLVMLILNYEAEIWGYQKICSKFCRKKYVSERSANLNVLSGELGQIPMYIHKKILLNIGSNYMY